MSIKQELDNLNNAFTRAAAAIEKELPQIWAEAIDIWKEPEPAVEFLRKPNPFLDGQSPAELASDSVQGEERVMTMLRHIQAGVYL